MTRIVISLFLISLSTLIYGQINKWQPDSVYANHKVKKIFVYMNSLRDLSEIVELDNNGNRIRIKKYNASYNLRTRKSKKIDIITTYQYDKTGKLIRIIDSTIHYNNKSSVDFKSLQYNSADNLISAKYFKGKYKNPYSTTEYYYNPFKTIKTRKKDSIIVSEKITEYEKGYYINRFYGYDFDHSKLERFEHNEVIKNSFDSNDRLIKSDSKSVFMNNRTNEYHLTFNYYRNGLLKSIRGYIPRFYKYEFYE